MNTEPFWQGPFGDEYLERNKVDYRSRVPFWKSAIDFMAPENVLEVGCNRGHNLVAIQSIDHDIECRGVDINRAAASEACAQGVGAQVGSAKDIAKMFGKYSHDLVFTAGVLIHVPPEDLRETMQAIIDTSKRYVLAIEYEAETETMVEYRGNADKLWKRPFGELYRALGLKLLNFGEAEGFDQCTYWLLETDAAMMAAVEADSGMRRRP